MCQLLLTTRYDANWSVPGAAKGWHSWMPSALRGLIATFALSDMALRLAAKLWAQARNAGMPTADPKELDCDVLIAAQALTLDVSNCRPSHCNNERRSSARFVPAALWVNIILDVLLARGLFTPDT